LKVDLVRQKAAKSIDNSVATALPGIAEELKSFNTGIVLLSSYFILEFGSAQGLYETPNDLRLPLVTAVLSILYAVYSLFAGKIRFDHNTLKAFAAFMLFMLIYTTAATLDPTLKENGSKLYLMYLVNYLVMVASVRNLNQLILIIDVWLASMAYTCLHGVLQGGLVWGNQWVHDENQFAVMCAIAFPFAYFLFITFKTWPKKACYAICIILYLSGIVMAASRGGLVSIAVVGIFCWHFTQNKLRSFVIVVATASMIFAFAPARFFSETQNLTEDEQHGQVGERIYLWRLAFHMYSDNKLLGIGPFNYGDYFLAYDQQAEARDTMGGVTWRGQKWTPHSTPIAFIAEIGTIGLAILICLLYCLFKNWQKIRSHNMAIDKQKRIKLIPLYMLNQAGIVALAGFWVGSLFLTLTWFPFFYCLVWFSDSAYRILDGFVTQNNNVNT
jgi:O-antigen ligase